MNIAILMAIFQYWEEQNIRFDCNECSLYLCLTLKFEPETEILDACMYRFGEYVFKSTGAQWVMHESKYHTAVPLDSPLPNT